MSQPYSRRSDLFLVISPFFSIFPALLLVLGALSDSVQRWCQAGKSTAYGILGAARTWCFLMLGAAALGLAVILLITVLAARALKKRRASGVWKDLAKMAVLPLAIHVGICGLMLNSEVLPLLGRTGADMKQIESSQTAEREVWFLPGSMSTHLPGYFGPEKNLTQYQVRDAGGETLTVYVPAELSFEPGGTWQSSQTPEWNRENIPGYRLSLTDEFHLAVTVGETAP